MRIFHIQSSSVSETDSLDALIQQGLPAHGYVWVACARREFEVNQQHVQEMLHAVCGLQLVDLHISDLINNQLPSVLVISCLICPRSSAIAQTRWPRHISW